MKKFLSNPFRIITPLLIVGSSAYIFYSLDEPTWYYYTLFIFSVVISLVTVHQSYIVNNSSNENNYQPYDVYQIGSDPELPDSKDNGNLPETLPLESDNSTQLALEVNRLVDICYNASYAGGWHTDRFTGKLLDRNRAEMLCLIHSEISEAMEGERKGLMDDHLPNRPMAEVELADAVIRIGDYCGRWGYDLGGAIEEKLAYNATRADHKPENRAQEGGKKF